MNEFSITLAHIESYLNVTGWHCLTSGQTGQLWNRGRDTPYSNTPDGVEILVPTVPAAPDFDKRFKMLIDDLHQCERRPGSHIIEDMSRQFHDVTNMRAEHEYGSDYIPLDAGERLFSMARDLMVTASASTISRRGYFGRSLPKKARHQAAKTLVGHTRPGSYIIPVINQARIPDVNFDADQPRLFEAVEESAFERRALATLAKSLAALEYIAVHSAGDIRIADVHDGVGQGLSYEMCRSVARALQPKSIDSLDVSIFWAPGVRRPVGVSDHFAFPRECDERIREIAAVLRTDPVERQEVIYGVVVGLKSRAGDDGGRVDVETLIDGSKRLVRLDLAESDYEVARSSHKHSPIVARGTLHRNPGRIATMDVVSFEEDLSLPIDIYPHSNSSPTPLPPVWPGGSSGEDFV